MTRTIIEPFRIKMTEAIPLTNHTQRAVKLQAAHYNVFLLNATDITIDVLTDSGTGAMSSEQWAALMLGDESYAGSTSWRKFYDVIHDITGFEHIFPTHQGRAAERIVATTLVKPGHVIPSNSHFDTTRANMEVAGAKALDLLTAEGKNPQSEHPFKGNMDCAALEAVIAREGRENIPFAIITVTNNSGGGQPVSLENIRQIKEVLSHHGIPLMMDACRFAENAYFIQQREPGQAGRTLTDIAREMFSYADFATMSAKKDGLANIGGFLACRRDDWAEGFRNMLILTEGFPTYGGLAGRDLEVIAVGLREALDANYQRYRHATVRYMADRLDAMGIPFVRPPGGHAIFLDAKAFLPHLNASDYPGIGLVNALYLEGGVRAVEIGSSMFGRRDAATGHEQPSLMELVRLAFPRRVYTQSHFDYTLEVLEAVWHQRAAVPAHRMVWQAPFLRHFTARFEPVGPSSHTHTP